MNNREYVEDAVIVGDEEDKTLDEVVESFNRGKIIYSNMESPKLYKQGRKLDTKENIVPNEMGSKHHLIYFEGTKKYRSVFRAMRRGRVEDTGDVYPKRPFNNRKTTNKRGVECREANELKKIIHNDIKHYRAKLANQSI